MRQPPNLLSRLHLALLLAWKDCVVRFQSGVTLVFVVVMPLAMVMLTGLAFKGFESQNLVVTVALEDLDGGDAGQRFRELLEHGAESTEGEAAGRLRVLTEPLSPEEARRRVRDGELGGLIVLPAGLSRRLKAGEPAEIELVAPTATIGRSLLESALDRIVSQMRERNPRPLTWRPVSEEADTRLVVGFDSFTQAVAGNGVMFILLNCILIGAMSIVRERNSHTLDRLMISPMSVEMIFLGKGLGVFVLGAAQALVIFGFGVAVLGVRLGSIVGVGLVTVLFILVGCSLALMISALGKREQTVQDIGAAVSLLMSALGGGMFPLQMAPMWMRKAALVFPTGWAMQAYEKLMLEGKSWTAVVPHLLVLMAFATVFFVIGSRALGRQAD